MRLRLLIDVTADETNVSALQGKIEDQPVVQIVGLMPFDWPGRFVGAVPAYEAEETAEETKA